MNMKIKYKYGVGAAMVLLMATACTDTWEQHYQQELAGETSLWEAISEQGNLSNFAKVIDACDYDLVLNGSQTYSVFAPTNACLSEAEADSLIENYRNQRSQGVKTDDNTVITQFVHNHIALYRKSVSSMTNDSITMMNGKYQVLTQTSLGGKTFDVSNELHSNGVLFTLTDQVDYFPNVFEYLGIDPDLDSVYNYINSFSVYEFDPSQSVAGGIVDGETVYLDSVEHLNNGFLLSYGLINSEDSTYWMLAPTNEVWTTLYEEYRNYYVYNNTVSRPDSMQEANAKQSIIYGAFFNRTDNKDVAFQDSAVSTLAPSKEMRMAYAELDVYGVYYKPFEQGGVFDGAEDIECSNGHVLKTDQFNIDKSQTFMRTIKVEAEDLIYQKSLLECETPLTVRNVSMDNPFYNKISGNAYVDVIPKNTTEDPDHFPSPKVTFSIPQTLSNIGYDIYVVTAPVEAYNTYATAEDRLPNRFRPMLYYKNMDGKEQTGRLSVVTSTPGKVDTLLVATNRTFPTCGVGLAEPVVSLQIMNQVSRSETSKYSTTLHLDCIIFKPHVEVEE